MTIRNPIPALASPVALGLVLLLVSNGPAMAYVGPGLGLATIGAILGGIGAVLLAILGLVWYPVKSMMKKKRKAAAPGEGKPEA